MALIAVPPGVHPVAADCPALAQVELYTDIRDEKSIVEQVCLESHVESFGNIGNGNGCLYRVADDDGPFNGITDDDGIPWFRLSGQNDSVPVHPFGDRFELAFDYGTITQFRKEMFCHIMPYAAAAQIHQLPLAGIDDGTVTGHPLGSVTKDTEGLLAVGHVGSLDKRGKPLPVIPRRGAYEYRIGDREGVPG